MENYQIFEYSLNEDSYHYLIIAIIILFFICIYLLNKYQIFEKYQDFIESKKDYLHDLSEDMYNRYIKNSIQNGQLKTVYSEKNHFQKILENTGIL